MQTDIDNPIWEKKYGNMSKVYIKIFKRRKFRWQQKINLKKDGEKIVEALKENGFDPDLETKIITHGYIDNGITFLNSFAEAYENRGKNNKKKLGKRRHFEKLQEHDVQVHHMMQFNKSYKHQINK